MIEQTGVTVTPRQILDVLEASLDVQLPARFSYDSASDGNLDLTVVADRPSAEVGIRLRADFARAKISVGRLALVTDLRPKGESVYPLRGNAIDRDAFSTF